MTDPAHTAADFIPAGLRALGIEADEVEMAVMEGTHHIFWPAIVDLLEFEFVDFEAEREPDLSRAP